MKKLLAVLLGALFVLSFAASAFAIHAEIPAETQAVVGLGTTQLTLGGELRTRGWYLKDITSDLRLPIKTNSWSYYDQRVRLSVDAKVAPGVEGFVQIETGNTGNDTTDVYKWGSAIGKTGGPGPLQGTGGYKPSNFSLLQAWILYTGTGLFGVPSGLKIGHMPLALGEMEWFDHTHFGDDAIVFFVDPVKEMHVALLTIKFAEDSKAAPSAIATPANSGNGRDIDGYVGLVTYNWDPKNLVGVNYTYLNQSFSGLQFSNLGLHANGSLWGLGYKIAGDVQFGQVTDKIDAEGWAIMGNLSYKLDPIVIRGGGAYGSGDRDNADRTKAKEFITFLGPDQHYTLVYDYQVSTAAGGRFTGLTNTTYGNLGIDYNPTKDIALSLDGYYLRASSVNEALQGRERSKDLGWELDAKAKYNVAKNLTYQVDAGVLFAGDFYKAPSQDNKEAYVLRHMLTLSF